MHKNVKLDAAQWSVYCGPMAVAAITGKPTDKIVELIRGWKYGGERHGVKGTGSADLAFALGKLGYALQRVRDWKPAGGIPFSGKGWSTGCTLAAFLRSRKGELASDPLIIGVTGHWVAVKGRKFCDTKTKGQWVWISKAPGRRKRVTSVWRVVRQ